MTTVLIIEDNQDNMDLIREILEDEGFECFSTVTAENGIELLNRGVSIDIILMDISLPKLDGYEATRFLKGDPKYKSIPIIMITAHAMREDREKGYAAGCDDFLTKPIDDEELLKTICKHIKREKA